MTSNLETGSTGEQSVQTTIRGLIWELAPSHSVTTLSDQHRLVEDLEYHSLALLELAFTLEDEFGLDPINDEDVKKIVCVGDVLNHVISELQRKSASGKVSDKQET
jgi:acyl carrier protein